MIQGFKNGNNICYFNALMQALLPSSHFRYYSSKNKLINNFLFNLKNDPKIWDDLLPSKILKDMNSYEENQSASEYCLKLLEYLKLEDLSKCTFRVSRKCTYCLKETQSNDTSLISLINDSLHEFFESEDGIEDVNCEFCHKKTLYHQKRMIHIVPPLIIMNLNKYYSKRSVPYSESFKINNKTYKLISIILHHGKLGGGHYNTIVIGSEKNYLADDLNISEYKGELRSLPNAYMLIYEIET